MQAYLTLTRRELAGYFFSIAGYVIIAGVTLLTGLTFVMLIQSMAGLPFTMPITEVFFNSLFLWIILILTAPMLTMRLFALEKASGTFETLMATPIGDLQVVAAKFTAAMLFYVVMWLPTIGALFIVQHFAHQPGALEGGTLSGMCLGLFLAGCLIISLGCFASSLTKSQVVAGTLSAVSGVTLLILNWLAQAVSRTDQWQMQVLSCFNLSQQMNDFTRGIVDTRTVVLYLSGTLFFLFLTLRVVESRRWK
jgi:ABC-2 type transport system permease protein